MATKPKLLIIVAKKASDTSTRYGGFVRRIVKNGGFAYADVDIVALDELLFTVDDTQASVKTLDGRIDLSAYAFVYFKSWQAMPELAAAAAHYLEGLGIPYADHQVRHEYIAKTTNHMQMWKHKVSAPKTIWGSREILKQYVASLEDDAPLIIKAVHGQKGKDNYLTHSKAEALEALSGEHDMMIQQYIPNGGDYRIGVYGHQARWAIYRRSGGTSHLNNTSAGGQAELLEINQVPEAVKRLAEKAADACELAVSGVDVVEHAETKKLYVFEANQGSQIVTGMYTESNMMAFDAGMKDMMRRKFYRFGTDRKEVIGRRAAVTLLGDGISVTLEAKVDTGAYQSAIDAENIEVHSDDDGKKYLTYTIPSHQKDVAAFSGKTYDFGVAGIKNSAGQEERRYVVPMTWRIHGREYKTRVTLANRKTQKCPVLIGRQLIRGNFLVNVELSGM